MMWRELADTLADLIEGVTAPPETGLVVTEALLKVPLEVGSGLQEGKLVFFGSVPHTRWKSGVLPQVHRGCIKVELVPYHDVATPEGDDVG